MNKDRIQLLNDEAPDMSGNYVLYWMQQSQRAAGNPALEYAVRLANKQSQGVVVCFGLMADYPEANRRHFVFMLEGLAETAQSLHERGIKFVAKKGKPDQVALSYAKEASMVVCDRGYLRHQRRWRRQVAAKAEKRVIQVEGDTVVLHCETSEGVQQWPKRPGHPPVLGTEPLSAFRPNLSPRNRAQDKYRKKRNRG
jgi:deoxyribodipyrimidine photo-lyase